jgi:RNA polymerase sigma-70 factor (ECF subfamily)
LPEGQREAVETLALEENSLEDASKRTGRTKSALKVNLHRAIKTLRTRMGGVEADGEVP